LRQELPSALRSLRKVDVQIIIRGRTFHKGQSVVKIALLYSIIARNST
jgi:hypothetical protein